MPDGRAAAKQAHRRRPFSQRARAVWRDTLVLVRQFRRLLVAFVLTVLLCSSSFYLVWDYLSSNEPITFVQALYFVITLLFFEQTLPFPKEWFLELYYFIIPVLGIIFLGLGVADFAVLLFNRRARLTQWEENLAGTFKDHIIVCGLGHVGIRVVRQLVVLQEDIVVIELKPDNSRIEEVRSYDVPVINGDARSEDVLRKAGLMRAQALIIATNNDLVNLQIVSRVREITPDIRVVMRMFEEELVRKIGESLKIDAVMSASALAAPAFVGAATKTEIMQTLPVADRLLHLCRIEVQAGARLDGATVERLEQELDVSVVMLQSQGEVDVTPTSERELGAGDVIHVISELPAVRTLATEWNRPNRT